MTEQNAKKQPNMRSGYPGGPYPNQPNTNHYDAGQNAYGGGNRPYSPQSGYPPYQGNQPSLAYPPSAGQGGGPQFQKVPGPSASQNPQQSPPPEKPSKRKEPVSFEERMETFSRTFVGILVIFIFLYMGWLYAPRIRNSLTFLPTNTPTPITPEPTQVFTPTVTPLATNTPTAVPTATPGPLSEYWVASGSEVDPAVPDSPDGVIVLHVDKSAEVNPPLDDIVWTSSEKIASDLGKSTYDEKWYATYSSGWIRWFMDRSLREGLYEVYVMDTIYSSGGSLDFTVKLGEQILTPLTGTQRVDYMTSQYEPQQSADVWRSLGIYYFGPSVDTLTVTTSWEERDEYTIVSVDRLLIVPRRITDLSLLNNLPTSGTRYVIDDLQADILAGDYLITQKEQTSWDDRYQLVMNPKIDVTVTYSMKEPWPIGNYQVFVWMPGSKGGITASVKLFVDNVVLAADSGEETISLTAPASAEGAWIPVGSWTTDRYYERPRKFKITFEIPADSSGEFPVDAIAFVHNGFSGE